MLLVKHKSSIIKRKNKDEIKHNLVLLDVILQQQPGHDLLLKAVIQLS